MKKTWALVWSNSCCGHPMLNEKTIDAVKRRLKFELGIEEAEIFEILPEYRYKAEMNGIVENELCSVFIGFTDEKPLPNPEEVENLKWIVWDEWLKEIEDNGDKYSIWCVEETKLLSKSELFHDILKGWVGSNGVYEYFHK